MLWLKALSDILVPDVCVCICLKVRRASAVRVIDSWHGRISEEGVEAANLAWAALPSAPDLRGRELHGRIIAGKAAVGGGQQIVALCLRDVGEVWLPRIRVEDRSDTLIEPVNFLLAEEEDAAQDEFGDAIGMCLGIGEGWVEPQDPPNTCQR